MTETSLDRIANTLNSVSSVLICAHVSPDVDAIGSACGLAHGLGSLGKKCVVYLESVLPQRFSSIAKGVKIVTSVPSEEMGAIVIVDTASAKRMGEQSEALLGCARVSISIDHHVSNEGWASVNYTDTEAAATAEIVLDLLERLNVSIDARIAQALYGGILDDTGCFRYSNTSSRALKAAAKLVERGARPTELSNDLYFSLPLRVLRLRAVALSRLECVLDGRISLLVVTRDMLSDCEAKEEDTEGLIDLARSVSGAVGAVFVREVEDGWKVSMRSKTEGLNVDRIATEFGGGGHRAAAGCTIKDSIENVREKVLRSIEEAFGDKSG